MFKKFSEWLLEQDEDRISNTIIGVVGGMAPVLTQDNKDHLLRRSTDEFGEHIKDQLRN